MTRGSLPSSPRKWSTRGMLFSWDRRLLSKTRHIDSSQRRERRCARDSLRVRLRVSASPPPPPHPPAPRQEETAVRSVGVAESLLGVRSSSIAECLLRFASERDPVPLEDPLRRDYLCGRRRRRPESADPHPRRDNSAAQTFVEGERNRVRVSLVKIKLRL